MRLWMFFTCGDLIDPWKAHESMKMNLEAKDSEVKEMLRGKMNN